MVQKLDNDSPSTRIGEPDQACSYGRESCVSWQPQWTALNVVPNSGQRDRETAEPPVAPVSLSPSLSVFTGGKSNATPTMERCAPMAMGDRTPREISQVQYRRWESNPPGGSHSADLELCGSHVKVLEFVLAKATSARRVGGSRDVKDMHCRGRRG